MSFKKYRKQSRLNYSILNYSISGSSLYGPALIILVALLNSFSNSLTHSLPGGISSSQILLFKAGIGFVLIAICINRKFVSQMQTSFLRWHFAKGFIGFLGNVLFIRALQLLPLADTSALSLTSALMTTGGAYYFFSERPASFLLYSLALGFVGVMLILKPSGAVFQIYSILPLASALAFAASSLLVKKICLRDSSLTTLLYLLLFMALFSLGPAIYNWQPMGCLTLLKLVAIAIFYAISQLCLIEAYSKAKAALLAPFKFVRFPIAILWGYCLFGEPISMQTLFGGGLIVASYFYLALCLSSSRRTIKAPPDITR